MGTEFSSVLSGVVVVVDSFQFPARASLPALKHDSKQTRYETSDVCEHVHTVIPPKRPSCYQMFVSEVLMQTHKGGTAFEMNHGDFCSGDASLECSLTYQSKGA